MLSTLKIPKDLIQPISEFVEIYCEKDKYSQIAPNYFYRVNNLYMDSPNFIFLKRKLEPKTVL